MKLKNFLTELIIITLFTLNSCMEISEQASSLVLALPSDARSAISSEEIEKYLVTLYGEQSQYSEERTALPGEAVSFEELEADVYDVTVTGFIGSSKVAYGEAQAAVKDGETSELQIKMKMILEKFTVDFETNGGSSVDSQTIIEGDCTSEPDAPTKEADESATYAFVGWYADEALENEFDFSTPIKENLTLYAKWENGYSVTFETNGGSEVSRQIVVEGKTASEPEAPAKNGCSFVGWFTDETLENEFDFATEITENLTLYARFECAVTFESNGGSEVSGQIVVEGKTVTEPEAPAKNGYSFVGWFTDETLENEFDFATEITEILTLYASWGYSVTFETNDGSEVSGQIVVEGKTVTEPEAPTKDEYTFLAWFADSDCTTAFNFSTEITANTTLYAKWILSTNVKTPSGETTISTSGNSEYLVKMTDYSCNAGTWSSAFMITNSNAGTAPTVYVDVQGTNTSIGGNHGGFKLSGSSGATINVVFFTSSSGSLEAGCQRDNAGSFQISSVTGNYSVMANCELSGMTVGSTSYDTVADFFAAATTTSTTGDNAKFSISKK